MATPNLTARDLQIMAAVFQCFTTPPQIDYDKLARLTNLKNKNSAMAVWGPIKKKILAHGTTDANNDTATPSTPKSTTATPKKRKTAAKADADSESPTKKGKNSTKDNAKGKKAGLDADATDDDEELDEETRMVRREEAELLAGKVKREPETEDAQDGKGFMKGE